MDSNATPESSTAASAGASSTASATPAADSQPVDVIGVLGNIIKSQTGEQISPERMAAILLSNMTSLLKQGKLNQAQILHLKQYADKYKPAASQQTATGSASTASATTPTPATPVATPASKSATPATTTTSVTPSSAFKNGQDPSLSTTNPADFYPAINSTISPTNPGPVQWAQARPTLTGGITGGRVSGTPAQIARSPEDAMLNLDDNTRLRRKNTPGDQSMRRTIQDLVASVDPTVKIEPEVEDLLLSIADEFIDSVTNFACRLAKHRGGDSLEVRDLQLHLERNHNIRIPGFASDESRISLSQTTIGPAVPATSSKKAAQGTHMTLRSQRLAQVALAKRETKLM